MKGGKVAWLIDPVEVNQDSLDFNEQTFGLERELNDIDEQIFTYGVRLNKDLVIDVNSIKIPLGGNLYKWYYYPFIRTEKIDNPIVNNVNPIRLKYASTMDLLKNPEITKTPLLVTSEKSITYKIPVRINYQMIGLKEEVIKYNATPNRIVAAMLEGKFKSNFRNRLTANFLKNAPVKHRDEGVQNKMLVISDGDIINAEVDSFQNRKGNMIVRPLNINFDKFDRSMTFGNKEFFVNAMESLMGLDDLIPLRSKTITLRPLNKAKVESERTYWKAINVFIPILVIFIFGIFYNFLRKKRFS
jgi:ABC-2 type transport system permease protein